MADPKTRKLSVVTVCMVIVVTTFGLANVINNLVELGLSAIPSWIAVGFVYFLPLALILAEFASDTSEAGGGVYSYMERGIGPTWAFIGTWSYFVSSLVYLQSSFSQLPIRASLAIAEVDVFETATALLPPFGVAICIALTYVSTRGVRFFSHLSDWVGKGMLALVGVLIVIPIAWVLFGGHSSATTFTLSAMTPALDLQYFATFSWLLFAVAGAEVATPYVRQTEDPQRNFPRAILVSTILIGSVYVLSTVAVSLLMPVDSLTKATGLYDIWLHLAALIGLPATLFARACMTFLVVGFVAAYIIWMESPIRVMFAEVPKGTFPAALTRRDADGTHHQALWVQAMVVSVLILIPLVSIFTGTTGSERFISLLNDMASLSLVIPYMFVALAYIRARRRGMDAPFKMVRSTPVAVAIGILVLVVSAFGYLGAGAYALQAQPIDWIYVAVVYGGPIALIFLGLALRAASMRAHARSAAEPE
jgi:amino acid transporter